MPIFKGDQGIDVIREIIMESHLLKLISHDDFICRVMEEIIEYNEELKQIITYVVIVEQAKMDLNAITKVWVDNLQSETK
jgi:hypothetical protein